MPNTGNPTWQDSPSTVTPINAARLNAIETALTGSAPVSSAWTANTPVKAGQLLTQAGVLYSVNADMTTPSSFATTGLTAVGGSGGGSSLAPTAVKTAAYTAAASDYVPVDTTSAAVTITLPTAPADKTQIGVKLVIQGGTNTVTIATGGSDVFDKTGGATSTTLTLLNQNKLFQYKASGAVWYVIDDSLTLASLDARYPLASSIAPLAQSGQTPSQAPVKPGTTAVGSLAFAARADHVHASSGLWWWLGDGHDGPLVMDGTTTLHYTDMSGNASTLTPSGNVYTLTEPIFLSLLTINSGVTLKVNGFPIHVAGPVTVNGKISCDGSNASGATGGAGASVNSTSLSDGGAGANGGTGAGAAGSSPARNTIGRGRVAGLAGAGGGSGATAGGGAGNLSGALMQDNYASQQIWLPMVRTSGYYLAGTAGGSVGGGGGGGAGAGDGTNAGGGGGGGAGVLILNCISLAGSGTITANGGNGANGVAGNAGGGGAGGGGVAFVNTTDSSGWTGTVTANNGTAGAGAGTGTAGSVGAIAGLAKLSTFG